MIATELAAALSHVLDTAMSADHAALGNLQLVTPHQDGLEITVQRGFDEDFLRFFRYVPVGSETACARALRLGRRVVVYDVVTDPYFTPYVDVATRAGFRGVQSTPIVNGAGAVLGVLSTHFREPHNLSRDAAKVLDACAERAAEMIEHFRPAFPAAAQSSAA